MMARTAAEGQLAREITGGDGDAPSPQSTCCDLDFGAIGLLASEGGWFMDQKNYGSRGVFLLVLGLLSGCASANSPFESDASLEMVVLNRTPNAATVFAWWVGGARIRLGEIGGNSNTTFKTPIRDAEVWMSLDVLSNRQVGRPTPPRTFIPVTGGDRIEWEIRRTNPIDVFYRRLPPQ